TRSAVSLQMQRLQDSVGRPLFHKVGRQLQLTPTGEALSGWAQRILTLNDEALASLRDVSVAELIRIGAPQDIVERWLPPVLSRFAAKYPDARLELLVGHSRALAQLLDEGRLDLTIRFKLGDDVAGKRLGSARVQLYAARDFTWREGEPLPLVLLEAPCVFRTELLAALDAAQLPWRVAVTSPGVSALWASVAAGLGVTARVGVALPRGIRAFRLPQLKALPRATLSLQGAEGRGGALRALRRELETELRAQLSKRRA
ncbi:MAG TPA: LysR substrate-binding domain-containing protein, partial [Polyangiales bacterium]|nr:LysR substrate-binding domain-containing protein [Polyangiales bacterium]